MSARSMKAKSIDLDMLEVASTTTFGNFFRASSCVSNALTARIESDGSDASTWGNIIRFHFCIHFSAFTRCLKLLATAMSPTSAAKLYDHPS